MWGKQTLRDLVTQRLVLAADEIFALIEQAFAEQERELLRIHTHKEEVHSPFPDVNPELAAEDQTLCDSLVFQFTSLKSEENFDPPSCLQQETNEEERKPRGGGGAEEEPSCSLDLRPAHDENAASSSDTDDSRDWVTSADNATQNNGQEFDNKDAVRRKQQRKRKRLELNESGVSVKREREDQLDAFVQSRPFSGTSSEPFSYSVCGEGLTQDDLLPPNSSQTFSCSVRGERFTRESRSQSTSARASRSSARGGGGASLAKDDRLRPKRKPARCPECGIKVLNLERHVSAVHRGERPYSCPICDRAFAQKNDCVIHMSTHTGAKPHACPVCHREFSLKKSMQRHKKLHAKR